VPSKNKQCTVCGVVKPSSEFEGRRTLCRLCYGDHRRRSESRTASAWLRSRIRVARRRTVDSDREFSDDVTVEALLEILKKQKGLCALSGIPMTHGKTVMETAISIDRIDSSVGYRVNNIQLVCHRINVMKMDMDDNSLWWWAKNLVMHDERREDSAGSEEAEE
jgi:hypothetical protein